LVVVRALVCVAAGNILLRPGAGRLGIDRALPAALGADITHPRFARSPGETHPPPAFGVSIRVARDESPGQRAGAGGAACRGTVLQDGNP
jgi:hypothetical protein